jgi:hypothetical protein
MLSRPVGWTTTTPDSVVRVEKSLITVSLAVAAVGVYPHNNHYESLNKALV